MSDTMTAVTQQSKAAGGVPADLVGEQLARQLVEQARAQGMDLEIEVIDPSQFSDVLRVDGAQVDGYRLLRAHSPAAPNPIAAILLALREATGIRPHCYFEWAEGSPIAHLLRYLILGRGDTAPVVREIIRRSEEEPTRRPGIHVGG